MSDSPNPRRIVSPGAEQQELRLPVGPHEVRLVAPAAEPESARRDERIYIWWGLTAAAWALARELAALGDLSGKRAVELGCGLGLPGLTAGLGGARVCFTDAKAEALVYARRNAAANGLCEPEASQSDGELSRATFEVLDWTDPGDASRYELVLGTEILYDYAMHRSLLELLPRLLAPGGTLLLADRRRLVVERLLGRLRDLGFRGPATDHHLALPGEPAHDITVFAWQRTSAG